MCPQYSRSFSAAPRVLLGGILAAAVLLPAVLGAGRLAAARADKPSRPPAPGDVECRWTDLPIRLDGSGDEPAWKGAAVTERFGMPWVGPDARPVAGTRTRMLWDREYLYFLAEMEDRDLFAEITEHDGRTWENDCIELFLKPAEDRPGYYELHVTPNGTTMDVLFPRRGSGGWERHRADGEFHLEAKVRLRGTLENRKDRDRGWTVEARIPWRDFLRTGGRPAVDEQWKLSFCRYDYSGDRPKPELSTTSPRATSRGADFHHYEDFGSVRFAGPTSRTARPFGIEGYAPVTTSQVSGSPDPPSPYRTRRVFPKLKLNYPVTVVREPGSDRLLAITQQWPGGPSKIVRFQDRPDVETTETLLSVDRTAYDLTFHPKFASNGYLYLGAKGPLAEEGPKRQMRISRYTLSRTATGPPDPASELPILEWPSDGHDGGAMVFGKDGMLYVTTGDGTSDSDTHVVGQDMTRLTAKLLRVDVDHPDPGRAYSVPKDNPFVGMPDVRPETWAYGFRNPWRMAVDPETGHIWVGNNGQDLWETAYLIERGANYGWSVFEGSHPFYPSRKLGPTPVVKPTVEHPHSEFRSLTGGIVYYGQRFPELRGAYIYGDYSTGKIWGIRHDGRRALWHKELADTALQITGFGLDSRGEILVTDSRGGGEGGFYTLDPTPKDLPPSRFPRRLSESGLFRSVKDHAVQPGLIPYSVNAPLWSDGAHKERFIALPGADAKIDFTTHRGWSFPDGTVLVKSFALEAEEGNPRTRRWIETRFLTKQDGEWVGYSYEWNEAQTDATLVEAKGLDRAFPVRVKKSAEHPDGIRKQVWRYPSRAECMACHTRAANYVLGLTLPQMNRVHDYGKVKDNQLRVLEHLGLLRVNWAEEARNALREDARARGLKDGKLEEYVARHSNADGQRQASASTHLALPPDRYPRLADPYDRKQDLQLRAKSYLQGNCAPCHVEAGGGNAQMELEFATPLDKMRILDVRPLHDAFGLPDPRLVAPGHPERSVLLHRVSHREKGHMPPLATSRTDEEAMRMLRDWIRQLKPPASNGG